MNNPDEKETATMLWHCVKCTAKYAAGLLHCPHCLHTVYQEAPGGVVEEGAPELTTAGHEATTDAVVESAPAADAKPKGPKAPKAAPAPVQVDEPVPAETAADAAPAAS